MYNVLGTTNNITGTIVLGRVINSGGTTNLTDMIIHITL
jgi:hypothetical protein